MTYSNIATMLHDSGLKASHQRMAIYKYLTDYYNHPTVEMIYDNLKPQMPSLSKTTVYNTLKSLEKAGLVNTVTIENNELRFDAKVHSHGHFKCEKCGMIEDIEVNIKDIAPQLKGFKIAKQDLFINGLCPNCQK